MQNYECEIQFIYKLLRNSRLVSDARHFNFFMRYFLMSFKILTSVQRIKFVVEYFNNSDHRRLAIKAPPVFWPNQWLAIPFLSPRDNNDSDNLTFMFISVQWSTLLQCPTVRVRVGRSHNRKVAREPCEIRDIH